MTADQERAVGATGRREYLRPPIVEALCQLTFATPLSWSPILPGMVFERIKSSYPTDPEAQQQVQANVQFANDAAGEAQVTLGQGEQRMIYRNETLDRLAVLSPSMISANSLAPYEGWPSLSLRLSEVIRRTKDLFRGAKVGTVSVRYINRVFIPQAAPEPFNEYFTIPYAPVGGQDAVATGLFQRVESTLSDGVTRGILTFSSAELTEDEAEGKAFVLDLEFARPLTQAVDLDEALVVADELKTFENDEFEARITDRTRELFE